MKNFEIVSQEELETLDIKQMQVVKGGSAADCLRRGYCNRYCGCADRDANSGSGDDGKGLRDKAVMDDCLV